MLKRLIRWFTNLRQPPPPEPLPEESWARMFELVNRLKGLQFHELAIRHLDSILPLYTDDLEQLFERLEFLILSIEDEDAVLPGWKDRRREPLPIRMPDYLYSEKHGYRDAEEVVGLLTQKIMIIHNLFDQMELKEGHILYPFIRREFTSVVVDTNVTLEFCLSLAVTE